MIVIQENRTVDNLFNGFPGANTQNWGMRGKEKVTLKQIALSTKFDPCHKHNCFVDDYDGGLMDGFDLPNSCTKHCKATNTAYAYVAPKYTAGYWQIASQFALADNVYQANQGPSFPAHQYLIAGQSGRPLSIAENPPSIGGGCDQPQKDVTLTINTAQPYPYPEGAKVWACLDYTTILDELDTAHVTWKYYTPTADLAWTAPEGVYHLANGPDAANIITPETAFLKDAKAHSLPLVSYVAPRLSDSDHAGLDSNTGGPDWVGSIVNQIEGDSYYAGNTVVFVVWDDWGGWYDHMPPKIIDAFEYGFRVPLLAVSPYVKQGVDDKPRRVVSLMAFLERLYGLPSLGMLDTGADDLFGMFQWPLGAGKHARHRHFTPIFTHGKTWRDYVDLPPDSSPVDD